MDDKIERARAKLRAAGLFFYDEASELDNDDDVKMLQTLNMNDAWGWACPDGEYVPDEELPELFRLFWLYGCCGVLYWVSERREQCTSEFYDVNRFVEFVRQEEDIRAEIPSDPKRGYTSRQYTLGETALDTRD